MSSSCGGGLAGMRAPDRRTTSRVGDSVRRCLCAYMSGIGSHTLGEYPAPTVRIVSKRLGAPYWSGRVKELAEGQERGFPETVMRRGTIRRCGLKPRLLRGPGGPGARFTLITNRSYL
jgi:hypothetical protein